MSLQIENSLIIVPITTASLEIQVLAGGRSVLYTKLLWWGQLLYKETAPNSNGNKHYKNVPQNSLFAVSPEIVPAPESHRNVASLVSSQSRITFGRSFSCQSSREKNIPQGVRV